MFIFFIRGFFFLEHGPSIPYSDLIWSEKYFALLGHGCCSAKTFTRRSGPVRLIPTWYDAQDEDAMYSAWPWHLKKDFWKIWTWYRTCLDQTGAKCRSIFLREAFLFLEHGPSIPYSDLIWSEKYFALEGHGCCSAETYSRRWGPVRFIPIWYDAQDEDTMHLASETRL